MRGSKINQLMHEERKALQQKRLAESKARKEKRKEKGRAEDIAEAIQRSPEARKATETLKAKRGVARKKEQANYQVTTTRASARMGGRNKQIQGELHNRRGT
jgi:hypothetical protein